jgi:hypothetical protein
MVSSGHLAGAYRCLGLRASPANAQCLHVPRSAGPSMRADRAVRRPLPATRFACSHGRPAGAQAARDARRPRPARRSRRRRPPSGTCTCAATRRAACSRRSSRHGARLPVCLSNAEPDLHITLRGPEDTCTATHASGPCLSADTLSPQQRSMHEPAHGPAPPRPQRRPPRASAGPGGPHGGRRRPGAGGGPAARRARGARGRRAQPGAAPRAAGRRAAAAPARHPGARRSAGRGDPRLRGRGERLPPCVAARRRPAGDAASPLLEQGGVRLRSSRCCGGRPACRTL